MNAFQALKRTDDLFWSSVGGCWGGTTSLPITRSRAPEMQNRRTTLTVVAG
jgi:hypothetical protein